MIDYTTTEFIAQVKNLIHVPTGDKSFTDADFLRLGTFCLQGEMAPLIRGVREDYFVMYKDFPTGQSYQYVPSRAMGDALKDVWLIVGDNINQITLISTDRIQSFAGSPTDMYSAFFTGNRINFLPTPNTGNIRMYFFTRPGNLVLPTACGQITSFDTNTNEVTVSGLPSSMVVGTKVDIVKAKPGFDLLNWSNEITNVSLNTVTLEDDLSENLEVGDWLTLEGESPVAQIPYDLYPCLQLMTAKRVCTAQGYLDKAKEIESEIKIMKDLAFKLITPRIENEPRFIVNDSGTLRKRQVRWFY